MRSEFILEKILIVIEIIIAVTAIAGGIALITADDLGMLKEWPDFDYHNLLIRSKNLDVNKTDYPFYFHLSG